MKKAFVISAASFIAIWAAVSASTKANAEITKAVVLPAISGLPLSRPALPRRKNPITITLIIIALIIDVTITIAAITENLMQFCLATDRDR